MIARKVGWFVVGCLVAGLVVGLLTVMLNSAATTQAIRAQQKTNTAASAATAETLQTIRDCTQPSGECYKRGQAQTANAVSNINQVIILAATCASGLPPNLSISQRQTVISSCVIQRLALRKR